MYRLLLFVLFSEILNLSIPSFAREGTRVDISDNCASVLSPDKKLSSDAEGLKGTIDALRTKFKNELCLYSTMDTIKTLASTTPDQRQLIINFCEGEGKAKKWVKAAGGLELCFLYTVQIIKEGATMKGMVKLEAKTAEAYHLNTKTRQAKACFDALKTLSLPTFNDDLIAKAQEAKSSLEDQVFGKLTESKKALAVLQVAKRDQDTESNAKRNENIELASVFFSPNDSEKPLHYIPLAALLIQQTLDEIIKKPDINLAQLLENFGYQAIVVNEKLTPEVIKQISLSTEGTGASKFAKGLEISQFEAYPADMLEYINNRDETPAQKYPLVIPNQILIIGKPIPELKGAQFISSADAGRLLSAKIVTKTPTKAKPEGEVKPKPEAVPKPGVKGKPEGGRVGYKGDLTQVISDIFDDLKPATFKSVVVAISPSWYKDPKNKPDKVKGVGCIYPDINYPVDFETTTLFITNNRKNFEAAKKRGITVRFDYSIHSSTKHTIGEYIVPAAQIPNDDPQGLTRKRCESSLEGLLTDMPPTTDAAYGKIAELLKLGGLEKVTFYEKTGIKDYHKANRVVEELKKKEINVVPFDPKAINDKERDKTLLIHDKGLVKGLNYCYHWGVPKAA